MAFYWNELNFWTNCEKFEFHKLGPFQYVWHEIWSEGSYLIEILFQEEDRGFIFQFFQNLIEILFPEKDRGFIF